MSAPLVDYTKPGPAGLYFDLRRLTRNAHIAAIPGERTARQALEHWCATCGQSACYGYGMTLGSEGVWSCADADCRAAGEAWAAERDAADRAPVEAPKPPQPLPAEPLQPLMDLFAIAGEAA